MILTDRWTPLRWHGEQQRYWGSPHRFNTLPAGRRSGKTELAKRKLVLRALRGTAFDRPRFFAAAPTRDQAKRIFWEDLKDMVPRQFLRGQPSESELVIRLVNGTEIHVLGLDKPQRLEGSPWDGGVVTETGNIKKEAWPENIRPALSDRGGWADLEGVPEGRNHYYRYDKRARARMMEHGRDSTWGAFHWTSAEILSAEEIAEAMSDLDELTFDQEYNASFINFEGQAYYPFEERTHCAPLAYDPHYPLVFCLDFNVAPGVAVVAQEQDLPCGEYGTGVIGEVWIPRNSNTPAVCRKLIADWGEHQGHVMVYGDATGGAGGSAKIEGSDWDLVQAELRPHFGDRLHFRVPQDNPRERVRINSLNSRLRATDGTIRLMVDPSRAPHTVTDLEGVRLLEGGSGEIDKKHDLELTHLSDGLGYYVVYEFPIVTKASGKRKLRGFY